MMLTSIDIGTNTILMLIADIDPLTNKITTLLDIQKIPRLGKGVDSKRNISSESIDKAVEILNELKNISYSYKSEKIVAAGTSFLRDANNKKEFISEVTSKTGIGIEILSGEEEAKWSFFGAVYDESKIHNSKTCQPTGGLIITIDIGGGSTEITSANIVDEINIKDIITKTKVNSKSIDIGSVRIKEKFLIHQPPAEQELVKAEKYIDKYFNSLKINITKHNSILIGLAGTITTLGALKLNLKTFDKEKVNGLVLTYKDVDKLLQKFTTSPPHHLLSIGEYMVGRADVILPGTMILKCIMDRFGFSEIRVSTKGLRYGLLLRELIKN